MLWETEIHTRCSLAKRASSKLFRTFFRVLSRSIAKGYLLTLAEYIRSVLQYKADDMWKPMFSVCANKDISREASDTHVSCTLECTCLSFSFFVLVENSDTFSSIAFYNANEANLAMFNLLYSYIIYYIQCSTQQERFYFVTSSTMEFCGCYKIIRFSTFVH